MQYKSRISSGKVVILGHLGMPGHKHLKWQYQFKKKKTFIVYIQAKNQLRLSHFPWDTGKILQSCYFGHFGACLALHIQSDTINLQKTFVLIYRQKSNFVAHIFLDIAKICKLLVLDTWANLVMHTKKDNNFISLTVFICMPKISFIISFILEILHLKESSKLIGRQHLWPTTQEPEFCQIWDCWWNIINSMSSFNLDYFQEKMMTKFFRISKNSNFKKRKF